MAVSRTQAVSANATNVAITRTEHVVFDQGYYDSVWGSVHRHDYCPYWCDRLIREYKSHSVLDIGTGCGYLVKLLCDAGVDAWGLDTSDYAIANSCAPGRVLKASVTDIPFKDEYFDVIFSNGLWEYLTLDEIKKGRYEIWRVGHKQIHNIDHDKCDYRDDFVTWKPQEWWDQQLSAPKIMVSCPTHELKEYAHQAWCDMAHGLDYPNYEIFVVDNSPTLDCYLRWKDKIPMAHIDPDPTWDQCQRMAASMFLAQQKFLREGFDFWFNVEIDVIPAPEILRVLLKSSKGADWTAHVYPARGDTQESCSGIGCSLWSRRLIEDFSFQGMGDHVGHCVDSYLWHKCVFPQTFKYPTRELWGHVYTQHLKEPE